jgi:tetratricopeptide (TPR) repeat protein
MFGSGKIGKRMPLSMRSLERASICALGGILLFGMLGIGIRLRMLESAQARERQASSKSDKDLALSLKALGDSLRESNAGALRSMEENTSQARAFLMNGENTQKAIAKLDRRIASLGSAISMLDQDSESEKGGGTENSRAAFGADYALVRDSVQARSLYEFGDYEAATVKFRALAAASPWNSEARLYLAASLFRAGRRSLDDLDEMEKSLSSAVASRGEEALSLEIRAGLLAENGEWQAALREYAKLEKRLPLGTGCRWTPESLRLRETALRLSAQESESAIEGAR